MTTRIGIASLTAATLLAAATSLHAQTFTTRFTSGGAFAPTFQAGTFSATFAGPSLSFDAGYDSILNKGPGTLSVTFSHPVTAISFDVGGLDIGWNDKITFSMAPTSPLAPALNPSEWFLPLATLSGNSLVSMSESEGGRVTFANLGGAAGVTAFSWDDVGTAGGSDWVLYDNFSFTVVPEPATLALAGLGAAALFIFRRRK
jgi:hypothetical protein